MTIYLATKETQFLNFDYNKFTFGIVFVPLFKQLHTNESAVTILISSGLLSSTLFERFFYDFHVRYNKKVHGIS